MVKTNKSKADKASDDYEDIEPGVLSYEEYMAIIDREARRDFGMTGEEFIRKWNAGEISAVNPDGSERREVMSLAILLPPRQ